MSDDSEFPSPIAGRRSEQIANEGGGSEDDDDDSWSPVVNAGDDDPDDDSWLQHIGVTPSHYRRLKARQQQNGGGSQTANAEGGQGAGDDVPTAEMFDVLLANGHKMPDDRRRELAGWIADRMISKDQFREALESVSAGAV